MATVLSLVDSLLNKLENGNNNKDDQKEETKLSKEIFYDSLIIQIEDYLEKECKDIIALTANCSALIYNEFHDAYGIKSTNWVGFYFVRPKPSNNKGNKHKYYLVLGPFQGRPACNPIEFDKGVCGYTATNKKSTLVPDVHKFPGHIVCDSASQSEVVIPVFDKKNKLRAILDIDCPELNGFDQYDQQRLEQICKLIGPQGQWDTL
eukprot:379818_1